MKSATEREMVFVKPKSARGLFFFSATLLGSLGGSAIWYDLVQPERMKALGFYPGMLVGGIGILAFCVVSLYLAYPAELHLDLSRHTYRQTSGILFWRWTRSGPFYDFSKLSLLRNSSQSCDFYGVKLYWKHSPQPDALLQMGETYWIVGVAQSRPEAEEQMQQLAKTLGLPAY